MKVASAKLTVMSFGEGGPGHNLLIVGESWAAGDRLFPNLAEDLAQRLGGGRVTVATIGFSGCNTRKICAGMRAQFPPDRIAAIFDGQAPHNVVILNGVNDVVQHVGAANYARHTCDLVDLLRPLATVQVVTVPHVRPNTPMPLLHSAKRLMFRTAFDGYQIDVALWYRERLRLDYPQIATIDYTRFCGDYFANRERFKPDGLHLTWDAYRDYGSFIARHVDFVDDGAVLRYATG